MSMHRSRKLVLVTGGSRGIGKATCRLLAKAGFDLVINYVKRRDLAEALADEIQRGGNNAVALQADVADPAWLREMYDEIDGIGPLAAVVNNAGGSDPAEATGEAIPLDRFQKAIAAILTSTFVSTQEALRRMSEHGGRIVNVSSYSVQTGGAFNHIDYAAAKAGVESLTRGFAREWRDSGVSINAVSPGTIDTDMSANMTPAGRARAIGNIPMGRLGRPEEVAAVIAWLVAKAPSALTGTIISVAGGRLPR